MLRVGIVGAGLIGNKRAASLVGAKLVAVADLAIDRAQKLAQQHGVEVAANWQDLVSRRDIDAVVVATSNDSIPVVVVGALGAGKHVLAEKPAGRNPEDLRLQIEAAKRAGKVVRVGFNHRFHSAFLKAKQMIEAGAIGPLMYIRARYGHGGRIGYDKEWRADPTLSGGGELLDQGVHLIDLCRWIGGEFELEYGRVKTFFWHMPVEDNGFLILKSPTGAAPMAFLHASCTEWKNLFDFEIFGRDGKLEIWGLGRSYGMEELRYYKMKPEMGPPEYQVETFPGEDLSWHHEFQAFVDVIEGKESAIGSLDDAFAAVKIVYDAYRISEAQWIAK